MLAIQAKPSLHCMPQEARKTQADKANRRTALRERCWQWMKNTFRLVCAYCWCCTFFWFGESWACCRPKREEAPRGSSILSNFEDALPGSSIEPWFYSPQILLQKLHLPRRLSAYLAGVELVFFVASAFRGCFRKGFAVGFGNALLREGFEDYGKDSCACSFRLTPSSCFEKQITGSVRIT